ncbi:hypothetical protein F442_12125 [Phytophthora nicotianae P10297]|uniref:Uncharacterized protein n=1 Tax=Phytophthora nicotianae P10297 TaxID=1317064 RepID=W2Z0Y4_PHYNI|nr:hypothetical protein F442_12125 [Phytophthora nicotianae P10297]
MVTPRRQTKRFREGTRGVDRSRDNSDKQQAKTRDHDLQPEHGDAHISGKASGEELLQLMEGCQIGPAIANGDGVQRQQGQVRGSSREIEARFPGTLARELKSPQVLENQTDIPPLTSRTRRSSIHRATQSPRIDTDRFVEGNNSSRELSTAPAPFASLRPEHLVGHVASVCALVVHDDRFIVSWHTTPESRVSMPNPTISALVQQMDPFAFGILVPSALIQSIAQIYRVSGSTTFTRPLSNALST